MTPEEKHLWYDFFKRLPLTVKRQHNIENYIVDFYIAQKKIVVEIDGEQHGLPEYLEKDHLRDLTLSSWNITVLRYTNTDIRNNFSGVTQDLLQHLDLSVNDLT